MNKRLLTYFTKEELKKSQDLFKKLDILFEDLEKEEYQKLMSSNGNLEVLRAIHKLRISIKLGEIKND